MRRRVGADTQGDEVGDGQRQAIIMELLDERASAWSRLQVRRIALQEDDRALLGLRLLHLGCAPAGRWSRSGCEVCGAIAHCLPEGVQVTSLRRMQTCW
jgi:hypothetical protein